jgi:magnesium-transporting ATPase (P-type)
MATNSKSDGYSRLSQESCTTPTITSASLLDNNSILTSSRSSTSPETDTHPSANTNCNPKPTININAANSNIIDYAAETSTSTCTRSPSNSATLFNPENDNNYTMIEENEECCYADINVAEAIIRQRCKQHPSSFLSKLKHKLGLRNTKTCSTKSRKDIINANDRASNLLIVNGTYIDIDDNDCDGQEETGMKIPLPHTSVDPLPPSNAIRTSRYTFFNFIPRQLIAQFSKVANLYFLFISVLEQIPDLAPTGRYVTILPLSIFVTIAMIHEAYDDFCRYRMDKIENERKCQVLRIYRNISTICVANPMSEVKSMNNDKQQHHHHQQQQQEDELPVDIIESRVACVWQEIRWRQLAVGDIVRIKQDDWIPADLLLLHSSLDDNICYVETAALDGETNLKEMRVPEALCSQTNTPEQIAELTGMYKSNV